VTFSAAHFPRLLAQHTFESRPGKRLKVPGNIVV